PTASAIRSQTQSGPSKEAGSRGDVEQRMRNCESSRALTQSIATKKHIKHKMVFKNVLCLMCLFVANPGSQITVGFVQLAEMVGHRGMTQQLDHAVLMFVRGLEEETPELATLRIDHAQLESDAH